MNPLSVGHTSNLGAVVDVQRQGGRWPLACMGGIVRSATIAWRVGTTTPHPVTHNTPNRTNQAPEQWRPVIAVHLVTDRQMAQVYHGWKGRLRVTDVLSFPTGTTLTPHTPLAGDVFVAHGRSRRDARRLGMGWLRYVERLVAHGVLHLAGWSHNHIAAAKRMEWRERKIGVAARQFRRLP